MKEQETWDSIIVMVKHQGVAPFLLVLFGVLLIPAMRKVVIPLTMYWSREFYDCTISPLVERAIRQHSAMNWKIPDPEYSYRISVENLRMDQYVERLEERLDHLDSAFGEKYTKTKGGGEYTELSKEEVRGENK